MTSYDTTYNRDLARSQRLYDYANIKNDTLQYNAGPTHQGGGMSGGNACGMGRPFSDVAKGMGMSGGVRRGAELADVASASGQFSVVPGRSKATGSGLSGGGASGGKRPHLVKGSAEAKAYMASIRKKKGNGAGVYGMPELLGRTSQVLEGRGGTDGFPSGFKDNNPNAMAGGRRGRGASGGAVPLKQQLVGILDDRTLNGSGMSGGDFWSDFGDGFMSVMKPVGQVVSAIAPFLGAGQSGGNAGVSSELSLMSGSTPLADAFLGGRRPANVPRDEKIMLMKKALADYAMMKQFKNHLKARQGGGMSGGGMSGGDGFDDFFSSLGQLGSGMSGGDYGLANSSIPMGMGMSGGGMSGGALSHDGNMAMADAMGDIFAGMGNPRSVGGSHKLKLKPEMYGTSMTGSGLFDRSYSSAAQHDFHTALEEEAEKKKEKEKKWKKRKENNFGPIDFDAPIEFESDGDYEGRDMFMEGTGKRPARLVKGSKEAKAYMASIRNKKGRGMSGGGIMEPAVSAEVGQPRYSYGNMADTAGKSNVGSGGGASGGRRRRGKGMSGGDFWSDLGSTALNLAPLLAFL